MDRNQVIHGDCLEEMQPIPDGSVDMILRDLPYGTTACSWDTIIPFEPLWAQYKRIIKDNGAIVLTASQPFTSKLVMSNLDMFKYSLVWQKTRPQGFAQAPYRFLTIHEDILIFSKGGAAENALNRMKYNPQGVKPYNRVVNGKKADHSEHRQGRKDQEPFIQKNTGYPFSILKFTSVNSAVHPTQKPVALFEYLIRTYTNPGDLVLDNCAGSGTTAPACIRSDRDYILIEKEAKYIKIINERIKQERSQMKLFNEQDHDSVFGAVANKVIGDN